MPISRRGRSPFKCFLKLYFDVIFITSASLPFHTMYASQMLLKSIKPQTTRTIPKWRSFLNSIKPQTRTIPKWRSFLNSIKPQTRTILKRRSFLKSIKPQTRIFPKRRSFLISIKTQSRTIPKRRSFLTKYPTSDSHYPKKAFLGVVRFCVFVRRAAGDHGGLPCLHFHSSSRFNTCSTIRHSAAEDETLPTR